MNQNQSTTTKLTIKTPTTLENVPEDVASTIAGFIKNWAEIEGNLEAKEDARRSRDSALRAVVLSSRKSHSSFLPILLQNITVDEATVLSLYHSLKSNPELGHSVKHFRFKDPSHMMSNEELKKMYTDLALLSTVKLGDVTAQSYHGLLEVNQFIYEKLESLQTLIMENALGCPSTFELPAFASSLKRLYIPLWGATKTWHHSSMNARNVIWLLRFCSSLQEVSLAFTISATDFDFLSEHHKFFSAASKVKKLSLQYMFVHKDSVRRTWWGGTGGTEKLKDKKTLALRMLLGITDRLECLEIHPSVQKETIPVDNTPINLQCLSSLDGSFKTLQHLRLLSVTTVRPIFNDYHHFRCLKSFSIDVTMVFPLSKDPELQLPITLERIILTYYVGGLPEDDPKDVLKEDFALFQLLNAQSVQSLPNLKEILVPSHAVDRDGSVCEVSNHLVAWVERRELLECNPIFRDGKVKLRTYKHGEAVTSDAETFMSTSLWLSPPQL